MTKTVFRTLLVLALAVFMSSCKQDEPVPKVYNVPESIQPYIDSFIAEAKARGIDLVIDNLIVEFETNLNNGQAAGTCTFAVEGNPPHIRLDTTSVNWQNNPWSRETLIFHELGHCILNRPHRDDQLPNGNFASLMRSQGEQIFGGSLNNFKRSYYLDELFNESVSAPDWSNLLANYNEIMDNQRRTVFTDLFSDNRNRWPIGNNAQSELEIRNGRYRFKSLDTGAYLTTRSIPFNEEGDFEIETRIRVSQGERSAMLQWGGSRIDNHYFMGFTPDRFAFYGAWETGTSASRALPFLERNDFNVLTIRKTGQNYSFFMNETLFDYAEFEAFNGNSFGFYVGPQSEIEVDYLRVYELDL